QSALSIAVEIDHRQWIIASHLALGALYLDVLVLEAAQQHLEQSLTLANQSGSRHWICSCAGLLASIYILQKQVDHAEALLSQTLDPDLPIRSLGQRLAWRARLELALHRGDGNTALQLLARLTETAIATPGRSYSIRLLKLRGEALM